MTRRNAPAPPCQILKAAPWQIRARRREQERKQTARTVGYDEQEVAGWGEWRARKRAERAQDMRPSRKNCAGETQPGGADKFWRHREPTAVLKPGRLPRPPHKPGDTFESEECPLGEHDDE